MNNERLENNVLRLAKKNSETWLVDIQFIENRHDSESPKMAYARCPGRTPILQDLTECREFD